MGFLSSIVGDAFPASRTRKPSVENADVRKSVGKRDVVTPVPDKTVHIGDHPSILSTDFNEKRAQTDAKFAAFSEGMRRRREGQK